MIPVIRDLSKSCGLDAKKLYLPLSYASILGGTCTLIGTATNLVINGMINEKIERGTDGLPHMEPVGMFDLAWIGVPATIIGIAFIMLTGKWLLPKKQIILPEGVDKPERRFFRVELAVEEGGPIVGKTIEDAGLLDSEGFEIICFHRGPIRLDITPDTILHANDKIGFSTDIVAAKSLWVTIGLIPLYTTKDQKAERHRHHLVEVVVSRRNTMLGLRVGDIEEQDHRHQVWLVGFARGESAMHYPLNDAVIQSGDVVLLEVKDSFFYQKPQ